MDELWKKKPEHNMYLSKHFIAVLKVHSLISMGIMDIFIDI